MIAQVDDKGNRRALFEEMMDHWTDGLEVKQQDAFIAARAGTEHCRETTKGREILIQWKDGRTTWVALKDTKNSCPVQLAERVAQRRVAGKGNALWQDAACKSDQLLKPGSSRTSQRHRPDVRGQRAT
jgi:hypothetical protein